MQLYTDGTRGSVHMAAFHFGHQVPLFRSITQTHATICNREHAMVYNVDARTLLVVEDG